MGNLKTYLTVLLLLFFSCTRTVSENTTLETELSKVPDEYKNLYNYFEVKLNSLLRDIDKRWNGKKSDLFAMASILPANSNMGPSLLGNMEFSKLYIDRLIQLGCKGVKLDIQFPVMDKEFYMYLKNNKIVDDSYPDENDFLSFYFELYTYIKNKGLKLSVEYQVTFVDDVWSPMPVENY